MEVANLPDQLGENCDQSHVVNRPTDIFALVEGRRSLAHCVAQVNTPKQQQDIDCKKKEKKVIYAVA